MLAMSSVALLYFPTFDVHGNPPGLVSDGQSMLSTTSAAEIFQYPIQTALTGIPGCRNLRDIPVYGKTQQEHDTALRNFFSETM